MQMAEYGGDGDPSVNSTSIDDVHPTDVRTVDDGDAERPIRDNLNGMKIDDIDPRRTTLDFRPPLNDRHRCDHAGLRDYRTGIWRLIDRSGPKCSARTAGTCSYGGRQHQSGTWRSK